MEDRFSRFTEKARRVLTLAQEEAQRLNHAVIGPEHILLGLVRERDGIAAKVLLNLNASLEVLREIVEKRVSKGEQPVIGEMSLSTQGKKSIELSVEQAKNLDHHYIGTEHLLLGLISLEEDNLATTVLKDLGLDFGVVQGEVRKVLVQGLPPRAFSVPPLTLEEEERVAAVEAATLESVKQFWPKDESMVEFVHARALNRRFRLRYARHSRKKQPLISLLGELADLAGDPESLYPLEPTEQAKAWLEHIVWNIWLPAIKDISRITPEDVILAESQFSEVVAKLK